MRRSFWLLAGLLLAVGCGPRIAREPAGPRLEAPARRAAGPVAPEVRPAGVVVPASERDRQVLLTVFEGRDAREAVWSCRGGQRRLGSLPPGGITLELVVEPGGRVSAVELASDTPAGYRGSYLATCLVREVRALAFPPSASPAAIRFEIELEVD